MRKFALIKVGEENIEKYVSFAITYGIELVSSWKSDELFNHSHYMYISLTGSSGITQEEKERLLKEQNFIAIKKIAQC